MSDVRWLWWMRVAVAYAVAGTDAMRSGPGRVADVVI